MLNYNSHDRWRGDEENEERAGHGVSRRRISRDEEVGGREVSIWKGNWGRRRHRSRGTGAAGWRGSPRRRWACAGAQNKSILPQNYTSLFYQFFSFLRPEKKVVLTNVLIRKCTDSVPCRRPGAAATAAAARRSTTSSTTKRLLFIMGDHRHCQPCVRRFRLFQESESGEGETSSRSSCAAQKQPQFGLN